MKVWVQYVSMLIKSSVMTAIYSWLDCLDGSLYIYFVLEHQTKPVTHSKDSNVDVSEARFFS